MSIVLPRPVVYIARDIERAYSLLGTHNYFVITNDTPFARTFQTRFPSAICLIPYTDKLQDTHELLAHPAGLEYIRSCGSDVAILVFKNTSQIERVAVAHDIRLLNPQALLANTIEQKISQIEWLSDDADLLPPHTITRVDQLEWNGEPYVVQFNHGHTGSGTSLLESQHDVRELINKFPEREVKRVAYIEGPVFTNNIVIGTDAILYGNISLQITGLAPFTDMRFATIGNDWGVVQTLLNTGQIEQYGHIARHVARRLQASGWHGLCGIDVKLDQSTGKLHLLEINARQSASVTYESELQKSANPDTCTTFEAHLLALLELPLPHALTPIRHGAQILQRVTHTRTNISPDAITKLAHNSIKTILYPNTELHSDLLRMQTNESIMKNATEFNETGLLIADSMAQYA